MHEIKVCRVVVRELELVLMLLERLKEMVLVGEHVDSGLVNLRLFADREVVVVMHLMLFITVVVRSD